MLPDFQQLFLPQLDWTRLSADDAYGLNHSTTQMHWAAQFLSMAGKCFLPHQADDSHTNMAWSVEDQRFLTHPIQSTQLVLHPQSFSLGILGPNGNLRNQQPLAGLTLEQGVEWVKSNLHHQGLDTADYRIDLHYNLPDHPLLHGDHFAKISYEDGGVFAKVRSLGHLVMQAYADLFSHATPVRTWPHHFDIGTYIPLGFDAEGETNLSITLGLAIADPYSDAYYFYVNHWARDQEIQYGQLPSLAEGGHWNQQDFVGAILPLSFALKPGDKVSQIQRIQSFMNSAIEASIGFLSSVHR
ncbi:MAG: hypothetical protein AAF206_09485 [Bacteroidota bacterium]